MVLMAFAVALDAFGVAFGIGIAKELKLKNKLLLCASFGFFQFLLSLIGVLIGIFFTAYISAVPQIIGGIMIVVLGILMIFEDNKEKDECIKLDLKMYFILGISVSIDALVVGFSIFNDERLNLEIIMFTVFIGIITFILSFNAFLIARYLNKYYIIAKYADFIGGVILVLLGIKMLK